MRLEGGGVLRLRAGLPPCRKIAFLVAAAVWVVPAVLPLSLAAQAPASPELSYTFHFERQPEPRLSIEARFQGGPQGFTVLGWCLSKWPDLPDCGRAVTGVTVRSGLSGKLLPLEHPEPNIWTCDHPPKEPLIVQYDLAPQGKTNVRVASAPPAPVVNAQHVLFLGDTALLVPEHLVSQPAVEIRYAWDGPLPVGWTAATSFAVADPVTSVRLPVNAFLQSVFFWGPVYLHEASKPGQPPLRVAWLGSEPATGEREVFLSSLLAVRGAVFQYLGQEINPGTTYFIFPSEAGPVSAMTLVESILFLADPKALTVGGEESVRAAITAAHELVHTSDAGRIKLDDAPVPANFFTEALAEFIARRALYRAGIITPKDWTGVVSGKLSAYASASGLAGPETGTGQVEPYVLGDLLVLVVDSEIRRVSGGKADILSLVSALLRRSHNEKGAGHVSWTDFQGLLSELTSASFLSRVEDVLRLRKGVRLDSEMFAGCLRVVETPVWTFDPGFEVKRSIEEKRVFGVRKRGTAWSAGLRDGDSLLQWSVQWNRSDVPVRFVVESQGKRRSVSYLPRGSTVQGSRQEVVPATDGTSCGFVL